MLRHAVLRSIARVASRALPNETGGTLVGTCNANETIIRAALPVTTGGRHRPTSFVRPSDDEDPVLLELESRSHGRMRYLGEWHSHPRGSVSPSRTDRQTMHELAGNSNVATDTPLLLIFAGDLVGAPRIGCYLFEATTFEAGVLPSGTESFCQPWPTTAIGRLIRWAWRLHVSQRDD